MDKLIQQLQQTPKWREFEEWYDVWRESNKKNYHTFNIEVFKQYCLDIQKGVFEKFIEKSSDYLITIITSDLGVHSITIENDSFRKLFYSFEELLIWYFNNEN